MSESGLSKAAEDVLAERLRQISAEGRSLKDDDAYVTGDLAHAAACYATTGASEFNQPRILAAMWPWARSWWKPTTRRRDLVKAGALILAEIERLDRAEARAQGQGAGQ